MMRQRQSLLAPPQLLVVRGVWSMKKDPHLEAALSRNRRWIANNQIKHFLLRFPSRSAPVSSLQRRFKTLGLRGKALNWLRKYPSCFLTYPDPHTAVPHFALSKPMADLVLRESAALFSQEPAMADRLARLLMLSRRRALPLPKLNHLKRSLGLPDDFLLRFAARFPGRFRVLAHAGARDSAELQLADWEPGLAVSAVEASAPGPPRFACSLPETWVTARARFDEFNEGSPYLSPYSSLGIGSEKWAVGMVHELLSLTLWKKASIVKLEHFSREFGLPRPLNRLLLGHPGIFYVSNRYRIYTVLLREAYKGSELAEKDPLVLVKESFGELMQEGLHEYNRRRQLLNIEKRRKRGEMVVRPVKAEEEEEGEAAGRVGNVLSAEERRRFYKVLFDEDDAP